MGTVVNGNIWAGACVIGKVVNGLVKNGAVFYKREIPTPSVYKRRIMVGDNLTGKTLYADFNISDYDYVASNGSNDVINMIGSANYRIYENEVTYLTPHQKKVYLQYYTPGAFLNLTSVPFIIMTSENEKTKNSSITIITDENDRSVTAVDENYTYRKIFIEDPNIRPLQVGDIVVSNTKFYFNVPDDFRSELPSIYTPSINDIIMLNKNGLVQKMRINYALNIYDECSIEYMKKSSDGIRWEGNARATIFDLEQEKNLSIALAGDMDLLEASGFVGTVTEINTTSPAYKYIMVDTTTLGE